MRWKRASKHRAHPSRPLGPCVCSYAEALSRRGTIRFCLVARAVTLPKAKSWQVGRSKVFLKEAPSPPQKLGGSGDESPSVSWTLTARAALSFLGPGARWPTPNRLCRTCRPAWRRQWVWPSRVSSCGFRSAGAALLRGGQGTMGNVASSSLGLAHHL